MTTIIANTGTTRFGFTDKEFAETIYEIFEIKLKYMIKPKQI